MDTLVANGDGDDDDGGIDASDARSESEVVVKWLARLDCEHLRSGTGYIIPLTGWRLYCFICEGTSWVLDVVDTRLD